MAGRRKRVSKPADAKAKQSDDARETAPGNLTRELPGGGATETAIAQLRVAVTAGPDRGKVARASSDVLVIGTHNSCDLVLQDDTVSRFHCDLSLDGERAIVRDLDSRNGTTLDGVSVLAAHVRPGSVIALGRTELRFELEPEGARVPISERTQFGVMVGRSPAIRRAFATLERAAASDATVLLLGETGTGKEAAAESLHRASARAAGPFVVIDCGAIPANLLESELFGHERGAFTGATTAREGAFEAANGGTVFLDEIGELSADLQPKLLRALERREVKRVGATAYAPIDVRVIAATHRDLRAEVNQKRFRADLYYRLAVIDVRLPALRERKEDIPMLAARVLETLGADARAQAELQRPELVAELTRHSWPGNVRELRNYLERWLALGVEAPLIGDATSETPTVDLSQPLREAREAWLRPFERAYVEGLLAKHDGQIASAARAAGIDRITFYRLLWKHGLR